MSENNKKFLTLEGLELFLEKFKYAMAHNGPPTDTNETSSEDSEEETENG